MSGLQGPAVLNHLGIACATAGDHLQFQAYRNVLSHARKASSASTLVVQKTFLSLMMDDLNGQNSD
jgi:hypothetical protein